MSYSATFTRMAEVIRSSPINGATLPDPAPNINFEQYVGAPKYRLIKYCFQMTHLRVQLFQYQTLIKVGYALDGLHAAKDNPNPFSLFQFARLLVELSGLVHRANREMWNIASNASVKQPEDRSRQMYRVLMRLSYGTKNKADIEFYKSHGINGKDIDPFDVGKSIAELDGISQFSSEFYSYLCDFVHHNAKSNYLAGIGIGSIDASELRKHKSGTLNVVKVGFASKEQVSRIYDEMGNRIERTLMIIIDRIKSMPHHALFDNEIRIAVEYDVNNNGVNPIGLQDCQCGSGRLMAGCHGMETDADVVLTKLMGIISKKTN